MNRRKIEETALYVADLLADTFIASKLPNVWQPSAQRIKDNFFRRFDSDLEKRRAQGWVDNLVTQTTDKLNLVIADSQLDDNELESVKVSFKHSLLAANDIFTPEVWIDLKLNRHDIEQHIHDKAPSDFTTGLGQNGIKLYRRLISDSAFLAVEVIPLLPNFVPKTLPRSCPRR